MNNYNEKLIKKILEILSKKDIWEIPVGVSNRHLHISKKDLEVLFGENYELTRMKDLYQPGEFAAEETLIIKGPKGKIENIRILGPIRENTQIEIALSDGFKLGVKPQVRESGKIKNTPEVELIGPKGKIVKREGLIAALRHIHMPTEIGNLLELKDRELVDVEIEGIRKAVLGNVLIRISDNYRLEMHIDTDEANACCLKNGDTVKIKKQ
ncbi:MAG: phosphate propanoyltransferase [Bacillota bacterium]|nr:phosphate propanoyltransferase [Bacillota bacterium]